MNWFDAAAKGDVAELERHLQRKQKIDLKDKQGWTALQHAIEHGHAKAVEFLLSSGADPNYAGAGFFALHAARPELLKLLLKQGLDPNGGEKGVGLYIEKAILVAAAAGEEARGKARHDIAARPAGRCLIMLIDAGARLTNHKWTDGQSPIIGPVSTGDVALLRFLVEHGADVNAIVEKSDDFTPLMWCAWYQSSSPEIIRALVKLGAKLEQKNRKGFTALDIATAGPWPNRTLPEERKHAGLLRELGAKETRVAKEGTAKRERLQAREAARRLKGDPIEKLAVAKRRGTIELNVYDSWISMAVRADDLDALADALEKSKSVRKVQRDVTQAALAGKLAAPRSRHAVILKLKGHTWASLAESDSDIWYQKFQKQFSRDARQPVITCGHQDTASVSFFTLHKSGKLVIDFESAGAYEDDPSGTRLKSDMHPKTWWQQHADENETIQALLRQQGAYVPMFNAAFDAFPEDTLDAKNVERVMLVTFTGKTA